MRNSWLIWVFIIGVMMTVFLAFNYQGGQNQMALTDLFPEEETKPVDMDYELVMQPPSAEAPVAQAPVTADEAPDTVAQTQQVGRSATVPVTATSPQPATATSQQTNSQTLADLTTPPTLPTIKRVDPAQAPTIKVLTTKDFQGVPYTIQAAAFRDKDKAKEASQKLQDKKIEAFIVSRDLGPKGVWYRLYVGRFQDKTSAQATLKNVKGVYKDSFIRKPQ